ncbi:MAG: competence protein ComEA [Clostridium sp.]|nr:competence protein ComEA [Clostridium sp.]
MLRDFFGQDISIKKGLVVLMVLGLIVTTALTGYLLTNRGGDIVISKKDADITGEEVGDKKDEGKASNGSEQEGKEPEEEIKVYVTGEVNNVGIVTLLKGQLISDAIDKAGGPTENADVENINMVYKLEENVMLKIKSKNEETPEENAENTPPNDNNKGISIISHSSGTVVEEKDEKSTTGSKININTATASELMTIPGVGPSTAEKIISYREQNGRFEQVADIMNVSGIGERKFEQMEELISTE